MRRRYVTIALLTGALITILAGPAFAPHLASLRVETREAAAGSTITVWGPRGYAPNSTVEVHFNGPDGPLLGTFETDSQFYAAWGPGEVTIPEGTPPGTYTLLATQELTQETAYIRGLPARAVIQVPSTSAAAPVAGAPLVESNDDLFAAVARPDGLEVVNTGPELWQLALVALGVAVVAGAFGLGVGRMVRGRREPSAEEVRSS